MKKFVKFIAICLVVVMAAGLFAACGPQSDLARIKSAGEIVMLTNAAFPPYEYLGSDNKPVGVDVDIAQKIADELGVKLKVVDMDFDGIIPALVAGKGDIGVSGFTIKPDRLESVDFSTKYAKSSQYMVVQKDNTTIKTAADLDGKVLGVQEGTTGDFYATDDVKAKSVERYKTAMDATAALMSGKIDAVIVDELPAKAIVQQNSNTLKYIDEKLTEEEYAIAIKKNSDLTAEINKVLEKLIADGTIDELTMSHMTIK